MDYFYILVINPGSTSTKLALYRDESELYSAEIVHPDGSLPAYFADQFDERLRLVREETASWGVPAEQLSCVVGRGGLMPPLKAGGYYINSAMLEDLVNGRSQPHASNLGAMLADAIARPLGIPSFIYDAVSAVDLPPVAQITGVPEYRRRCFCHVLNSRAVARFVAGEMGRRYEDCRFIVAHLGGGISVSTHCGGRIIDAAGDDDGAFSPERAGGLPLFYVIDMCYSGKYTKDEMITKIRGIGGLRGLLGTADCRQIEQRIADGDEYASLVYDAEAYQIAKGINIMSTPLKGEIDAIILTGGMAHSEMLTGKIVDYVNHIAPVRIYPGQFEMQALALGALRILRGEERAHVYGK